MRIIVAVTLALLVGCSRDSKSKPSPESTGTPSTAAPSAATAPLQASVDGGPARAAADASTDAGPPVEFVGIVRGVVRLAKGVSLPLAPVPKMGDGSLEATSKAPCPPIDTSDRKTVTRAEKGGGLSPIHVAITGMSQAPKRAPKVHELFIDACRLRPGLVGAVRGDTIRVTSRSDMPLLPVLPGDKYMTGMMRNESREFELTTKGSLALRCTFGIYCGESTVVSLSHPLFAVTDAEGSFVIEQVPLDQELQLHAWHPLFTVKTVQVRLSRDEREKTVELLVEPTPAALVTTQAKAKGQPAATERAAGKAAASKSAGKPKSP